MALLGSSVDPRLFMQDYSGFTRAAEIQAQGMQNLGEAIGQGIESYAEAKEKRKKIEASTKASRAGIESAIKLGEAYGIDIKSSLEPILTKMDDPNTTPMEAAMYGEEAKNRITNVLNMGITASEREGAQQRAMMEQQYKMAGLGLRERQVAAAEYGVMQGASELKETEISIFDPEIGKERKEKVLLDKQGQYYDRDTKRPILDTEKYFYGEEGALGELPPTSQVMPSNGKFGFTYNTRDKLPASTSNARQISLDFNDAANKNAKGIEIIIPNNATSIERALAMDYVNQTKEFFASKGVDVPVRGVKTAAENKRGSANRFHTEPFFVNDSASRAAIESDPDGYAQVLANTIGKIPGAMFIPPHKSNDPGASANGINERDFAKGTIIPALERFSKQQSAATSPAGIDNALAMGGDMTQQAMGTPDQQAEAVRQIEQGQQLRLATAQNLPQGAIPTEPSMAAQQPQLPQPQRKMVRGIPAGGGTKFRQFTPEEVTQYGSQGQVNVETGEVRPIRPPSGMVIEQTKDGGFRIVQGAGAAGRQEQAAQAAKEQGVERATMGTQEIGRALKVLDSGVMQGSGPLASFYRAGAAKFVKGTPEYQLANNFIAPIKSMLAFNELNKMRMASPTGGALGNVAKFETDMLQQSAGQLDIDKTDPQTLRENLMRLSEKYLDAVHGTIQDREKLLRDNKISKETFLDILSLYPAFTMGAKGEMKPRQVPQIEMAPEDDENARIEAILKQHGVISK